MLTPQEEINQKIEWSGLTPHQNEGEQAFMLRLRIPTGSLTAPQLKMIARIASEKAKDFADITTRQDLQLHWVKAVDVSGILEDLRSVRIHTLGIGGDTLRNIVGCPVSGVDALEYFDASPLVTQVQDFFQGNPEFSNLPRKVKVSIAACREQCQQPEIHCVSFVGMERRIDGSAQQGFDVRAGGGLALNGSFAQRMNAFIPSERVLSVLKAILELYRAAPEVRGDRSKARLKFLIADWGIEKFRQAVQAKLDFTLEEAGPLEDPPDAYKDHVGVHEQRQPGLFYIGVPVLIGRISGPQMRKVADLAERHGNGSIRLTVRQNLLILNVQKDNVASLLEGLESVNLSLNASPILRGVVTCTGKEFCRLAVTETKRFAGEIVEYLQSRVSLEEPLRIHVAGCPAACAQSPIAHIGLQGSQAQVGDRLVEAYDLAVGGQLGRDRAFNHFVAQGLPAGEVKFRLEQLLVGYKKLRKVGETFNDFCRRLGDEGVARLLSPPEPAASPRSNRAGG